MPPTNPKPKKPSPATLARRLRQQWERNFWEWTLDLTEARTEAAFFALIKEHFRERVRGGHPREMRITAGARFWARLSRRCRVSSADDLRPKLEPDPPARPRLVPGVDALFLDELAGRGVESYSTAYPLSTDVFELTDRGIRATFEFQKPAKPPPASAKPRRDKGDGT